MRYFHVYYLVIPKPKHALVEEKGYFWKSRLMVSGSSREKMLYIQYLLPVSFESLVNLLLDKRYDSHESVLIIQLYVN